jgi:hypothetical protein
VFLHAGVGSKKVDRFLASNLPGLWGGDATRHLSRASYVQEKSKPRDGFKADTSHALHSFTAIAIQSMKSGQSTCYQTGQFCLLQTIFSFWLAPAKLSDTLEGCADGGAGRFRK